MFAGGKKLSLLLSLPSSARELSKSLREYDRIGGAAVLFLVRIGERSSRFGARYLSTSA